MKNEMPVLDREDTGFEKQRNSHFRMVGSLLGGLAALVLVLGLVALVGLNTGKGPSGQPGVGAQPVATNTAGPQATPTPKPFDGKTPTAAQGATPTPVPYTTPTGSPPPPATADPRATVNPNATATPVPFDSRTPATTAANGNPTPTADVSSGYKPVDTTPFKLDRADNVTVLGLANIPVNYDYSTLPASYQSTKPEIHFYASKNDPVFIEKSLYDSLVMAGYSVPDPTGSAVTNGGIIPQGGVFIYARKGGQPDLFMNIVSIANETEVKKLSQGGFYLGGKNFETQANSISLKGYPYLIMVLSGDNLLTTINGGSDPTSGNQTQSISPTPVK